MFTGARKGVRRRSTQQTKVPVRKCEENAVLALQKTIYQQLNRVVRTWLENIGSEVSVDEYLVVTVDGDADFAGSGANRLCLWTGQHFRRFRHRCFR